jgi:hypothetical protein
MGYCSTNTIITLLYDGTGVTLLVIKREKADKKIERREGGWGEQEGDGNSSLDEGDVLSIRVIDIFQSSKNQQRQGKTEGKQPELYGEWGP